MRRMCRPATRAPSDDPLAALSDQQRRMLPLIVEGKTNREIAAALFVSEHTVKAYVSDVLRKLRLTRRSQVAALIARRLVGDGSRGRVSDGRARGSSRGTGRGRACGDGADVVVTRAGASHGVTTPAAGLSRPVSRGTDSMAPSQLGRRTTWRPSCAATLTARRSATSTPRSARSDTNCCLRRTVGRVSNWPGSERPTSW
jgi:DNA-binding CsgD family transcriptional regulator